MFEGDVSPDSLIYKRSPPVDGLAQFTFEQIKMATPAALFVEQPIIKQLDYRKKEDSKLKKLCKIPRFKTRVNCSAEDVAEIRKLLTLEKIKHEADDPEACKNWTDDYARMMHDDWLVSRFLLRGQKRSRSNQINKSLYSNTMDLIRDCVKFRYEYQINGLTDRDEFPREWLDVDGIFNYKPDRAGNPTIYLRVKLHKVKLIETKELRYQFKRLLLYYLECCDRYLVNEPGRGICCVFDLSQATFENLDVELVSWMLRSFKSCGPKLLSYIIVYNIPWFLNATLKLLFGTVMARSNDQKMKFVYGNEILDYIEQNNLPAYMSKAKNPYLK